MAQSLGTFDFRKLVVILGVNHITGYAEGDAVEISQENNSFNSMGGADGYVDRVRNRVDFLTIVLRLRQTTPSNEILSTIHNIDRAISTPLPLLIRDESGLTFVVAEKAWIVKFPTIAFGNEVKQREWTIHTGGKYECNIGGNAE